MTELINQPESPESSERPWLKHLWPWFSGLLAFLVGLFWFLPLNHLAREALSRLSSENFTVDIQDIELGLLGSYKLTNVKLSSPQNEAPLSFFIPFAKGRLSLLSLLAGNFKLTGELQSLQIKKGAIKINGGIWNFESFIAGIRKSVSFFKGEFHLTASSFLFVYDEPLPLLEETLEIPISLLKLQGKIEQGMFKIQSGVVESRLGKVVVSGSTGLSLAAPLEINMVITPTEELFQKYQDKGLKEILSSFKLMQTDGRLQFQISGTLGRPVFRSRSTSDNP